MEEGSEEYSENDPNLYHPRMEKNGRSTNPQSINQGLTMTWELMMTMPQPGRRSSFFFDTLSPKGHMTYPSYMPYVHPCTFIS
ncbi:hypothetical protein H5410_037108 [Solanum commersonii]|uniref:Uncharacterized protein n=1 Tax=Solanum commersonii TaxID=4109 RepID=A0A9J5Y9B0_SOLCO|nr:hypothetical protein H5410_037108 [Solanum commersonii]